MNTKDFSDFIDYTQDLFPGLREWLAKLGESSVVTMGAWRETFSDVDLHDAGEALRRMHRGDVRDRGEVYRPIYWGDFPPMLRSEAKRIQAEKDRAQRIDRETEERRTSPKWSKPIMDAEMARCHAYLDSKVKEAGLAWPAPAVDRREFIRGLMAEVWPQGAPHPTLTDDFVYQPPTQRRALPPRMPKP